MNKIKKIAHKWAWLVLMFYYVVGMFYPLIGLAALICMLAPSIIATFKGRMWCGNFCPRGSFNDNILILFSKNRNTPKILKTNWMRILFLVILMSLFTMQIIFSWGNIIAISFVFIRMIMITTVITIILGIVYKPRTWCSICPMGTLASYVSKFKIFESKIKYVLFNKNQCINCNVCSQNCVLEIDVLKYRNIGKVEDSDCLKCDHCINKCPKKALSMLANQ